jgi:hypothetical protein
MWKHFADGANAGSRACPGARARTCSSSRTGASTRTRTRARACACTGAGPRAGSGTCSGTRAERRQPVDFNQPEPRRVERPRFGMPW